METTKWYKKNIPGQLVLAYVLIIGGLICGIYFLTAFDTSVEVPGGQAIGIERVNNIGLLQDRQNGIYLGFGAAVVGVAIRLFYKPNGTKV